jgi:hypothetical protein
MTLPEAIVYLLASSNRGMKTDKIAAEINARGLYRRNDGRPVDGKQVYAVVMTHPDTFVKSDGLIRLMI